MTEIIHDGKRLVPSREAARRFTITNDYIGRLCKQNKVSGSLISGSWYVNEESLRDFLLKTNREKYERREALREERARAYREAQARLLGDSISFRAPIAEKKPSHPPKPLRVHAAPRRLPKSFAVFAQRGLAVMFAVVIVVGGLRFSDASVFQVARELLPAAAVVSGSNDFLARNVASNFFRVDRGNDAYWIWYEMPGETPTIVPSGIADDEPSIIERVVDAVVPGSISEALLNARLAALESRLMALIALVPPTNSVAPAYHYYIDNSSGVGGGGFDDIDITNSTFTGGSITNATITGGSVTATSFDGVLPVVNGGTGTSTYAVGDILYADSPSTLGRLAQGSNGQVLKVIGGNLVWSTDNAGGGGSGAFATTSDDLAIYVADPSDVVIIGSNATTTTGNILEVAGNALFRGALTAYDAITAPVFTATSTTATSTFAMLNITGSLGIGSDYITDISGDGLSVQSGALSLDRTGDWTGTFDGLEGSYYLANSFSTTSASYFISQQNLSGFSTTSADYWKTQRDFFATTSVEYWKSVSNFFSTTSAEYFLSQNQGAAFSTTSAAYFLSQQNVSGFSTTSADFWQTQRNFFSTTSTDNWKSVNNFFSTTSADFWKIANDFFSTSSAQYFVSSSTTIPKTYTANTFTALQTFGNASSSILSADTFCLSNDCRTSWPSAGSSFAYPFPNDATSTTITFNNGIVSVGSTTINGNATTTGMQSVGSLYINGERFTDLTGSGLLNTSGVLTLNTGGDWTGTFDGQEGSYYLANSFSTTSAAYFSSIGLAWSTTSANYYLSQNGSLGFSTTSNDYWMSQRNFFSTTSANYWSSLGLGFSTSSADAWKDQRNFFSTTSASYFLSQNQGNAFSTTSANYWETQQTARTADDLSNNSIEDLQDVAAMTENYGDLLFWNGSGWADIATSSLGLPTSADLNNYLNLAAWYATTTDGLDEGSTNLYFTNARVQTYLDTIGKGYFFSTTSADAWKDQRNFFSTTSAAYFSSVGLAFSTTSSDHWASQHNFFSTTSASYFLSQNQGAAFSTTSANYFVHSSTTVPKLYTFNTWTGGNIFANATTTYATTTNLFVTDTFAGAGLGACNGASDKLVYNAATMQFECGSDAGAGGGITSLRAQYSSNQTGSAQVFATSSDTNLQLTITSSGDTHTFTPIWSGVLAVNRGGTGLASAPNYGELLIGDGLGGYMLSATSSLGLSTSDISEGSNLFYTDGRVQTYLDTLAKSYFFATSSADYWKTQNDFFSTTSANYWQTTRDFFSTTSASYFLSQNQGAAFSTTSANYWKSVNDFFSTTSADYYKSVNNFFSTTSADYWGSTKGYATFGYLFPNNATTTKLDFNGGASTTQLTVSQKLYLSTPSDTPLSGASIVSPGGWWGIRQDNGSRFMIDTYNSGNPRTVLAIDQTGRASFGTSTTQSQLTVWGNEQSTTLLNVVDNASTTVFTALTNGNVGVGTTTPGQRLSVVGSGLFTGNVVATNVTATGTLTAVNGAFTNATTTNFGINSETFTDLTGTGLTNAAGILTLDTSGNWTGTFDGQEGSYYLANSFSTTSANYWQTTRDFFSTTSAIYFAHSSTTIPKTYSANTFTALQSFANASSTLFSSVYASSTNLFAGAFTLGSLNGPLQANNGVVSATSSLLAIYGGTGLTSYSVGDILYADSTGSLARLPVGGAGTVLKVQGGLPSWQTDLTSGGGGGATAWSTTTDSLAIYPSDTTDVLIVGANATVTANSILEVFGRSYFSQNVGIGTTSPGSMLAVSGNILANNITAASFFATSTAASVFPYASTTALSATTLCLDTDCRTSWPTGIAYPFSLAGNATSTLTQFNGGLTAYASSTIGNGAQAGGLTVSGGATTTGNAYFGGAVNIGSGGRLSMDGSDFVVANSNFANLEFWSGGAQQFTIGPSGNVFLTGGGTLTLNTSLNGPLQAINGEVSATSTLSVAYGGTGLSIAPTYGQLLVGNASGGYTLTATSSLGLGTISSIGAAGQQSTGPSVTFATSTGSFNGLTTGITIVGSGNTQTFTPSLSGTLAVGGGGTGATSFTDNRILTGNGTSAINDEANLTFDGSLLTVTGTGRISSALQVGGGGSYEGVLHVNVEDVPGVPASDSLLVLEHNSQNVALNLFTNNSYDSAIYFGDNVNNDSGRIIYDPGTASLSIGTNDSTDQLILASNGRVGIGTDSPSSKLTVVGEVTAANFTATSSAVNTFPTLLSTNATTTNLGISGVTSALLATDANGTVVATTSLNSSLLSLANGYTFRGSAGNTAEATSTLFVANSGRVGVNTTNPQYMLDVAGAVRSQGASGVGYWIQGGAAIRSVAGAGAITYLDLGTVNIRDGDGANANARLNVYGAGYFSGNVGIGTTTPGAKLGIQGNIFLAGNIISTSTTASQFPYASTTVITATTASTTNLVISGLNNGLLKVDGSGSVSLAVAGTDYTNFAYPFPNNATTTKLDFDGGASTTQLTAAGSVYLATTGGNVGIGTTSPSYKLTVNGGNAYIQSAVGNGRLYFPTNTATVPYIGSDTNQLTIDYGSYAFRINRDGGTSAMYFDTNGNVSIGTTNPAAKLDVLGTASSTNLFVSATATTTNLTITGVTNALLATDASGRVYATTSISSGLLNTSGDWTGTFDGQEGSYYLANSFSTTSATYFTHSSTTIPKTYTANVFTGANTFNGAFTLDSLNGPLQANNGLVSATSSIGVLYGGTGLTTAPTYGQLLVGNASGGYTLTATSSLGLQSLLQGTQGQITYFNGTNSAVGTSTLFITTSGRVGVGTTTPGARLHFTAAGTVEPIAIFEAGSDASLRLIGGVSGNPEEVYMEFVDRNDPTNSFTVGTDDDSGKLFFGYGTLGTINGHNQMALTSGGNLGIGTSSPYQKLSVAGNVIADRFIATSTTASQLPFASTTAISATTASTTNLLISSIASGSILKTTTSGQVIAAVAGTDYIANTAGDWTGTFDGQEGSYYLANSFSTTSANYWQTTRDFFSTTSSDYWMTQRNFFSTTSANYWKSVNDFFSTTSAIYFAHSSTTIPKTYTSNTFTALQQFNGGASSTQLTTTGSTYLATTGGNVGIGTTTPGAKLDVNGTISTGGTAGNGTLNVVNSGGSLRGSLYTDSTDLFLAASGGSADIFFRTQAANRMIIDANGNVGIGTDYMPTTKLDVLGTASSTNLFVNLTATTTNLAIRGVTNALLATDATGRVYATTSISSGLLNTSGDWTGTFDGQEGSYYLANSYSTTSADYWMTQRNFFSTTSANYWQTTRDFFSTTSAIYFAHSSTTIPKTYSANTFTALQTFTNASSTLFSSSYASTTDLRAGAFTLGSLNGPLQANNGLVSATTSIGVLYGGTGLTTAPTYGQLLVGNASGGYTLTATSSLGLGTISSIGAAGQQSTGPSVTFATSTGSFNGLTASITIVGSGNTQTFTPSLSGTLTVGGGGTGATSFTSGSLIYGSGTGALQSVATTTATIGSTLSYTGTFGALVGGSSGTLSLNLGNANTWTALQQFGAGASSTALSAYNTISVGRTSTTTIRGDNQASTLPYASTTAITATTASTTNLVISGLNNGLLKASADGTVALAVAGTDYSNFAYPFPSNATSTLLSFNGGLTAYASSTIGNGAAAGGLTISGNATTTGNLTIGRAGVGTGGNTRYISEDGNVRWITGLIPGGSPTAFGIYNNVSSRSEITIVAGGQVGIGTTSPASYFGDANDLVVGSGSGNNGITIASGNTGVGNLFFADGISTVAQQGAGYIQYNHASDHMAFATANATERLRITSTGNVGIGTTSPFAKLSVAGSTYLGGNLTATGTVQFTNLTSGLLFADANGNLSSVATSTWTFASSTLLADHNTFSGNNRFTGAFTLGSLNGPLQANNGVVSATSSIGVLYGGTGLTTAPTYGQLLLGNSSGGYTLSATSSLGLQSVLQGTQGQIAYFSGTNTAVGTSTLFIGTNRNVGIGTTSPVAKLSVTGSGVTTGRAFSIANSANAERFFVNDNGSTGHIIDASTFYTTTQRASGIIGFLGNATNYFLNFDTANRRVSIGDANAPASLLTVAGNASIGSGYKTTAAPTNGLIVEGNVGIGTTSPYAKLSVVGDAVAARFVATTSAASIFPYASTTALSATSLCLMGDSCISSWPTFTDTSFSTTSAIYFAHSSTTIPKTYTSNTFTELQQFANASSTLFSASYASTTDLFANTASTSNLTISALQNGLLKVDGSGNVSLAVAGTDFANFAYPFPNSATSTLLSFNGGLTAYASTTIGDGTRTGGLTVNGGATTTGTAYFGSYVGINVMDPVESLEVGGNINIRDGYLTFQDQGYGIFGLSTPSVLFYNDSIRFVENGQDLMRVMDSGNVGIGTTSPGSLLSIGTTNGINFSTATSTFSSTGGINLAGGCYAINGTCITGGGSSLFTDGGATTYLTAVDNLGLGTTTANSKLTIFGDIFAEGSNRYLNFGTATGTNGYGFRDNGGVMEFKNAGGTWQGVTTATTGPTFMAVKSATQDINGTPAVVTWESETFDTNGNFASNRFTPTVPGKYLLTLSIYAQAVDANERISIRITKNGSIIALQHSADMDSTRDHTILATVLVDANGSTDYFEALAATNSGATETILNLSHGTYFTGTMIAPVSATAGGWTNDNTQSYLIDTTDKVGIGTTTPWAKLAIQSDAGQSNPVLEVASSSTATKFLSISGTGFGTTTLSGLNISGSATTTSNVGMNITSGCYAINGACLGSGGSAAVGGTGAVQFANGSSLNGSSSFFFDSNRTALGIGTSTPRWALTVASSTGPQLALTDGSLTSSPWTLRSINGNLFFATSSPSTFATSSIAALMINANGTLGIGTSTPVTTAQLDVFGDAILSGSNRYLNFATTTGANGYGFRDNGGVMEFKNAGGTWQGVTTATTGPSFHVHRNSTDQTVTNAVFTLVNWTNASFDTNGNLDLSTDRFQPTVPGKYILNASAGADNPGDAGSVWVEIRKNGTAIAQANAFASAASSDPNPHVTIVADANGTTDYFEVYAMTTGGGALNGATDQTFFTGALISPVNGNNAAGWANDGSASFLLDNADSVGIGTTSPAWKLAVAGSGSFDGFARASYFSATSTTASVFPYASTTAITATTASTTNLIVSGLQDGLLKVGSSGVVSLAVAGTDYSNFAYLFPSNATSTTLSFTGGFLSTASSTFTSSTFFPGGVWGSSGNVGIGTTTPAYRLEVLNTSTTLPGINIGETSTSDRRATIGFGLNPSLTSGWIMGQALGATTVKDFYLHDISTGATRLLIDTSGNFGIGTTSPLTPLHVYNSDARITLQDTATGASAIAYHEFRDGNGTRLGFIGDGSSGGTDIGIRNDQAGGGISFTMVGASSAMYIDSTGNVGIGTTGPAEALSVSGSVLATGQFLGNASDLATAPSFTWNGDTDTGMWRAGTNAIGFTTGGTNRLTISSAGAITMPNLNSAGDTRLVVASSGGLLSAGDNAITAGLLRLSVNGTTGSGNLVFSSTPTFSGTVNGVTANFSSNISSDNAIFTGDNNPISNNTPGSVMHSLGYVMAYRSGNLSGYFGRTNDGAVMGFYSAGAQEGHISISGSTVSYNAFTGSHYATTDETIERGMLVEFDGTQTFKHGTSDSEPTYGVRKTSQANSPAVFGSFLSLTEPLQPHDPIENPYLIMAVGNGDMWVVQGEEESIGPGDYLISSHLAGHAMKDPGTYMVSHIVARAAQMVDWSAVPEVAGMKRVKISVTFEQFDRNAALSDVFAALATSTASSTDGTEVQQFAASFMSNLFSRMTGWLADAGNGIAEIFAKRVKTQELCVQDEGGAETCLTKAQLDALLAGAAASQSGSGGEIPTLEPEESGDETATSTPSGSEPDPQPAPEEGQQADAGENAPAPEDAQPQSAPESTGTEAGSGPETGSEPPSESASESASAPAPEA